MKYFFVFNFQLTNIMVFSSMAKDTIISFVFLSYDKCVQDREILGSLYFIANQ